jgi:hypothetical protein
VINQSVLRSIALQVGLSQYEIQDIYKRAIDEAKHLGKQNDDNFILDIIKSFSGLDEEDMNIAIKKLNAKFIESGYTDFDQFLEDSWAGSPMGGVSTGIQSTDFPSDVRPEHKLGHSVKMPPDDIMDDEEDEKKENVFDLDVLE